MLNAYKSLFTKKQMEVTTINKHTKSSLYTSFHQILNSNNSSPIITTQKEKEIIKKITSQTNEYNLNNLYRTNAYLQFFRKHSEIHWSFLAHMVSRNGGYNITDLKGDLIGPFINKKTGEQLFSFLERANALIFHNAYPQLLLYELSKREGRSYFYLLPLFRVSMFMRPIWEYFLASNNSALLTLALITNEQHYVEKHLMSLNSIKESIFHSLQYVIQEKLGLTHVLFPYKSNLFFKRYSLAGIEVHQFSSVNERIKTGKILYSILFDKKYYASCLQFATHHPHTASRVDYWPHLFSNKSNRINLLYSPTLRKAWKNTPHSFKGSKDWFHALVDISDFEKGISISDSDITKNVKGDLKLISTLKKVTPFMK